MLKKIKDTLRRRDEVLAQLERQLKFKADYGIDAHKITRIVLKPVGRETITGDAARAGEVGSIRYESVVTLRDGSEHHIADNAKKILDGYFDEIR